MKISTQKEKTSKASVFGKIGIFSASLLAASSAVYLYSPVIGSHADSSAVADVNVDVGEVLSVRFPEDVTISADAEGGFKTTSLSTVIDTNNQYGYSLTLSAKGSQTSLKNGDYEIKTVSSLLTNPSYMDNNTYGYLNQYLDMPKVHPIPKEYTPDLIKEHRGPVASETVEIPFYFKLGPASSLVSGTYSNTFIISVYANGADPFTVPTTPDPDEPTSACDGKTHVINGVLTDPRDNNEYTVAELADGKCWMTENLRLVGPVNLTSANSSVSSDFNLPAPVSSTTSWTYERVNQIDNLSDIPMHMASSNSSYGVYYNWFTATAGTGFAEDNNVGTAPSSICPNGWHLPSDRDWYNFTYAYSGESGVMDGPTAAASPISMVYSGAVYAPQTYNSWKAYIGNADHVGYLWSASKDGVNPITMDVYDSENTTGYGKNIAMTISHGYEGDGYPIRCVAN